HHAERHLPHPHGREAQVASRHSSLSKGSGKNQDCAKPQQWLFSKNMALTSSFLRQYRFDGRYAARQERALAAGRAFLTTAGLAAIYMDPTEPARLASATYAILFAYAIYSLIVLVLVRRKAAIEWSDALLMHGVDIVWTSGLIFVSDGPVSPFFP